MNPKMTITDYNKNFVSKRKQNKDKFLLNIKSTYSILLTFVIALLLYYVWILNVNATKWYNIRQLEIEKRNLLMEKELLDVKIAELESLDSISNKKDTKNMDKVSQTDFLVVKNNVAYTYAD